MPLTPFHWSVLLLGLLAFDVLYLPALLVSSVLMDVEPFYNWFIVPNPQGILHGFFHTFLGATLMALVVAAFLLWTRKRIDAGAARIGLDQPHLGANAVVWSSVFAAWSHIFLDALMHPDMKPFWPLTDANPFLGMVSIPNIYLITGLGLIVAIAMTGYRIAKRRKTP